MDIDSQPGAETAIVKETIETNFIVFATESVLHVISGDGKQTHAGVARQPDGGMPRKITHVDVQDDHILVAYQGGLVSLFKLSLAEDFQRAKLEQIGELTFDEEVSALCLSSEVGLAYIALYDAPFYSLICVSLEGSMFELFRHSIGLNLDLAQIRKFYQTK